MKITQKHKKAALLCAQGYLSLKQIANEVGVARQTLVQWKTKADFKALIIGYNEPLFDTEVRERNLLDQAYKTLQIVMENGQNDGAKVNAAKYVIDTFRNKKGVKGKFTNANDGEMKNILKLVEDK
jgi:transposase-like protein|tara:strand:- start:2371 stop:2748 length:378 start_codon:yes stop_codon:yes gene_type:complete